MSIATAIAPGTQSPEANDPWSMEVGAGGSGGDYVLCPPGNYPGIVVGVFDVGHQSITTKDKGVQEIRKLVLAFELTKKKPDGKPFVLGGSYTWSMKDNSNFYKLVTNVTGKKFKEGERFDPRYLLDGPVMVNVSNSQSGEKTYHNIEGIAQFPDGLQPPKSTYKATSWSVMQGQPFPANLDWLPYIYGKSIRQLAESSAELGKSHAAQLAEEAANDLSGVPY
ncbi:phage replication initiation protein, NGO0469 family [Singulisphaera sp. PoT]|uniref:phage replication initiation protein, NGO0469 family n=1 Tax=Singulisphaera sp. PoT TaxID=3411797 RepID=UPI003BF5F5B4